MPVLGGDRDQVAEIGRRRRHIRRGGQLHHEFVEAAGQAHQQHPGVHSAHDLKSVRNLARAIDERARTGKDPFTGADESDLALEDVEGLVLVLVRVVRRAETGRHRRVLDDHEEAASCVTGGPHDCGHAQKGEARTVTGCSRKVSPPPLIVCSTEPNPEPQPPNLRTSEPWPFCHLTRQSELAPPPFRRKST